MSSQNCGIGIYDMAELLNMVMNLERWDGISKTRNFNEVCSGFPTEKSLWEFNEPIVGLRSDMVFLDVGCGPGRVAGHVLQKVKAYYGVEPHTELLEIAREHYKDEKNVHFIWNNSKDLSIFPDAMFDYVYERLMFIHVPKETILGYIHEMFRVLKPTGVLNIPDLPSSKHLVNGLTLEEVQDILKGFSQVHICDTPIEFQVVCIK
jgi:SAM-dependent methyltransferase